MKWRMKTARKEINKKPKIVWHLQSRRDQSIQEEEIGYLTKATVQTIEMRTQKCSSGFIIERLIQMDNRFQVEKRMRMEVSLKLTRSQGSGQKQFRQHFG